MSGVLTTRYQIFDARWRSNNRRDGNPSHPAGQPLRRAPDGASNEYGPTSGRGQRARTSSGRPEVGLGGPPSHSVVTDDCRNSPRATLGDRGYESIERATERTVGGPGTLALGSVMIRGRYCVPRAGRGNDVCPDQMTKGTDMRSYNVGRILQQVGGALARDSRHGAAGGVPHAARRHSRYGRRTTPTTAATGGGLARMVTRFLRSR